ncbi:hypothetical protein F2P81_006812 [Scophthalmus maximus]|uniref:Protein kinase domain-containing protein n=1 Tax=Scophthalmus maximus TaxID=52904 RepID=A0A6A4TCK4_SCOMX|nr:hypothetical protein F2P81_006812 [Scophthalmus maximus]
MAVVGCGGTRTTCNGVERVQVARREVNGYKGVVVASEQKLLLLLLLLQMCSKECNIVLEKMPVVPQGATQKSSLPSIIKGLQKNAQALISKGWQKTPSYLHAFKIINDHLAYRFQILEVIGTGYSGEVIKCLDHKTKERVAVKVFRDNSSVRRQGEAEVKILKTLRKCDKDRSANIVHIKEKFYFRQHLCITFDLFDEDLYRALKRTKKPGFSERELRKYTMDMLKCLQLLKKNNIVHGDLKTNNILVLRKDREKHVAVGDYGGSYLTTESHKPPIHTLNYVAPELLLGKRCSPAIDMWSLGCILAELHIGHLLFIGSNNLCQFRHIMEVLGVPPSNLLDKAPNRDMFFDSEGLPLQMEKITRNSTTLAKKLGSKNAEFVDFIEGCLQYNPKKRMTPEQAMHHPWITQKSKYAAAAAKSRSGAGRSGQIQISPPVGPAPAERVQSRRRKTKTTRVHNPRYSSRDVHKVKLNAGCLQGKRAAFSNSVISCVVKAQSKSTAPDTGRMYLQNKRDNNNNYAHDERFVSSRTTLICGLSTGVSVSAGPMRLRDYSCRRFLSAEYSSESSRRLRLCSLVFLQVFDYKMRKRNIVCKSVPQLVSRWTQPEKKTCGRSTLLTTRTTSCFWRKPLLLELISSSSSSSVSPGRASICGSIEITKFHN